MGDLTTSDNYLSAEQRGVATDARCYRVDISGGETATVVLPFDIKVCTIQAPVATEVSLAYNNGVTTTPSNLTGGNDPRKLPLAASTREPIAQNREFNTIYITASTTDATTIKIWVGDGQSNGLSGSGYVGA